MARVIIDYLAMNKLIPLGLIGVVIIIGAIYFFKAKSVTAPEAAQNSTVKEEDASIISSIKDAMRQGQTMQCTYKAGNGDAAGTYSVYVSGNKFKAETDVAGSKMMVLSDGDTQYMWNNETKQAFSINMSCLQELQGSLPNAKPDEKLAPRPEDFESRFNSAENVRCEKATEVDFSVPKDIVFTDQCAMMKQAAEMMRQQKFPVGY